MSTLRNITFAVALGAAVTFAGAANAASITGLYNTGVDDSGNVVANGTLDTHYTIVASSTALVTPFTPVVTSHPTNQWSANDAVGGPGSAWISIGNPPPGTGGVVPVANTYDYELKFDLGTLSAASAIITGDVQSDNYVDILLNGVSIGGQPAVPAPGQVSYFRKFTAFGASDNFIAGENTLTFRVYDYGIVTGLRVGNLIGTAVPEPTTWAMLILGFGVIGATARSRRAKVVLA